MDVEKQIELGLLVCPKTKQRLSLSCDYQWLGNADKTTRYKYLDGKIPVLLIDPRWAEEYANDSEKMIKEYNINSIKKQSLLRRIRSKVKHDYRTESSKKAFRGLFNNLPSDALCLSVGGGPTRAHPMLTNLNICPFPNVDVVADAHCLPYAEGSVDVIHSEAVFEHLYNPVKATEEMYRVLKPGKRAYICTPFMQAYHGYPHHYQNYTITGHKHLFESVGFRIVEAGACVGPVYTIISLVSLFFHEYSPHLLKTPLSIIWGAIGLIIIPLDKFIGKRENAYVLASTTYIIVEKSQ